MVDGSLGWYTAQWQWPQYAVIVYLILLTVLLMRLKFTTGNHAAPGLKLWLLTFWAIFVYAIYAGGFWK